MEKEKESVQVSSQLELRTYTGTKTIKAAPMGANDARHYGAAITEETVKENIGNAGYLVQYPDGYRSWSPKKVFDEAYRLSETKVDRMKIELADLVERIKKVNDELYDVREHERTEDRCLCSQLRSMQGYADMLYSRIVAAVGG